MAEDEAARDVDAVTLDRDADEGDVGPLKSASRSIAVAMAAFGSSRVLAHGSMLSGSSSMAATSTGRRLLGSVATDLKDKSLRDLLNFDGCEDLLRGCTLQTVIRRGSRILSSSGGDASTYALSRQTGRLQAFISHNWAVSRWHKHACLAFHYNSRLGVAAAVLVTAASPLVHYYGVLPTVTFFGIERGLLGRVTAIPAALFALYFGRDLLPVLRGPTVFLDKVCIHQEDKSLQRQAIYKLGAFLKASDTMLICYTDLYLTKLWTVYEVASYLSLFGAGRMRFTHCSVSFGMTIVLLTMYFVDLALLALQVALDSSLVEFAMLSVSFVSMTACGRAVLCGQASMHKHMVNFSVHNCSCFHEPDRAVVYRNIAALMKAAHECELTDAAALQLFDNIVRHELPQTMDGVFGRFGVPLHIVLFIPGLLYLPRIFDGLPWLWSGGSLRLWYVKIALFYVCMVFIVGMAACMIMMRLAGCLLHRRRAVSVVVVLIAALAGIVCAFLGRLALLALEELAVASDAWLAGYTALAVCGSAFTLRVYAYGLGSCLGSRGATQAAHDTTAFAASAADAPCPEPEVVDSDDLEGTVVDLDELEVKVVGVDEIEATSQEDILHDV